MSECSKKQVSCPRCHYDSPMTVWNSINVDLDPELKEKLLDGELYHWKCEVCGLEIEVPFGTLYHDMEHKFMLFFSPWKEEDDKYGQIKIQLPYGMMANDYTFRSVFGMNELREKISILEAGLSDIAVERMKFFLKLDNTEGLYKDDALFFLGVDTDSEKIKSSGRTRGAIKFLWLREGKEPEILTFPMEGYYDYLLAVNMDPRMKQAQCACIDEEWIRTKLQEM